MKVTVKDDDKSAFVVVPDNQLSLAIGKAGQNVRLAARLTGWRIDIRSEAQVARATLMKMTEADTDEDEEPVTIGSKASSSDASEDKIVIGNVATDNTDNISEEPIGATETDASETAASEDLLI